jgi:hypothetical protein|tara:strand:- start:479 stop:673 length:195 start_codon:yes stop_codon:yes gene_type:complete
MHETDLANLTKEARKMRIMILCQSYIDNHGKEALSVASQHFVNGQMTIKDIIPALAILTFPNPN